jgi:hypothetical protein
VVEAPLPPAPPPDEVGPLLSYHQSLRRMSQGELLKELSGLGLQQRSPRVAIQMGMALMLTRGSGDLARAQSLLDSVATSAEPEAAPLRPLAQLLSSNCAETRRLYDHADKLAAQQRDSQRRIDQLNDMLEGLKPSNARCRSARHPATGDQMSHRPGHGAHLLLVDDDDLLRLLSMRLGANGYRVTAVGSAEGAGAAVDRAAAPGHQRHPPAGPRRHGAVPGNPPQLPGAAGDPADRARHHPRRGGSHHAGRLRLPDQAVRRQAAAGAHRPGAEPGRAAARAGRRATRPGAPPSSAAASAWTSCWPRRGWWPPPTPAS